MCPCVLTVTGTVNRGIICFLLVVIDGSIDVDLAVQRATEVVVTTVDACTIAPHLGIAAVPVDVRLIYVASILIIQAIGTTEDGFCTEGRTLRHIDYRASCDTFLIAAAIDSLELSAQQVDDGRSLVCRGRVCCCGFCHAHTYATVLSGSEDLGTLIGGHGLRHVHKDIAAVLHEVFLLFAEVALSGSVDVLYGVERIIGICRTEVDKGIAQERLGIARLGTAILIEVLPEVLVFIVIYTVCSTENLLHAPLYVFYVCRGVEHIGVRHFAANSIVAQTAIEVCRTQDFATQVIAAIEIVADVWETICANIGLGMSEDVGIARTGEGVEDTSVTQIDDAVASYGTQEAATIHKLALCHVLCHVIGFCDAGNRAVEVYVRAVFLIIGVFQFLCCLIIDTLSYGTFLAASEYLEDITAIQVDGSAAPYFCFFTLATAKHIQCRPQHVHSLLIKDDARISLGNLEFVVLIEFPLPLFVAFHLVEYHMPVNDRGSDIDNDIAIHYAAVVTAAIDVSAFQTAVDIIIGTDDRALR